MRTNIPRSNFSSGIVSKELSGRIDSQYILNGVEECVNFDISQQGFIKRRCGTRLVKVLDNLPQTKRYFEFSFNKEQQYILQFFEKNFVVLVQYVSDYEKQESSIDIYKENGNIKYFSHPFNLSSTPSILEEIQYTQNNDVIYFTHKTIQPVIMTRTYDTGNNTINFTFSTYTPESGTGLENPFSIDGYPSACCFFQNRIFFAGFSKYYNKIWASDMGYYKKFSTNKPVTEISLDIDGFNFVLSDVRLPINWLESSPSGLIIGSSDGMSKLTSTIGTLTPTSFNCKKINTTGCMENIKGISFDNTFLYVDITAKKILALNYDYGTDSFITSELTVFNKELVHRPITKVNIYQNVYETTIYIMDDQYNIYMLKYSQNENYFSFSKFVSKIKIRNIFILKDFFNGNNLYFFDDKNNVLKLDKVFLFRDQNDFLDVKLSKKQNTYNYYNYLKKEVMPEFAFLDYYSEYKTSGTAQILYTPTGEYEGNLTSNVAIFNNVNDAKESLINDREHDIIFEPIEIVNEKNVKVKVTTDISIKTTTTINNWTFDKNKIKVDKNIYYNNNPNNYQYTIYGDGYIEKNITIDNDGNIQLPAGIFIGQFIIGVTYESFIKTFPIGGMIEAYNSMIKKKNIYKIFLRLYKSFGGYFIIDNGDLKPINYKKMEFARYDVPHTIMNDDVKIDVIDTWSYNKSYIIYTDDPFPFQLNSITLEEDQ
ncbi:MAG: hypothetical protein LBH46_01365 [Rickettsiales bacterium]|jgi:hypothetical protein|nr:hypothetical protein [Rickettsiales bacterium]